MRMRMRTAVLVLACLAGWTGVGAAQRPDRSYPASLPGARVEVYKQVGDVSLNMYIFEPQGHSPDDRRPAIVFFFGGGWRSGTPAQFQQQCKLLAEHGMVAMTADYRVLSRHKTPALTCVADAKSAVRWIRKEAGRLGIDPDRVAAGGGSAGGHIAACTGVIPGLDEQGEDLTISSVPNALVLFNPALILGPAEDEPALAAEQLAMWKQRLGTEPRQLSPYHHIHPKIPPTIIFHGKADTTVPYRTAQQFTDAMRKAGNDCRLSGFENEPHGFFNYGRGGNKAYTATTEQMLEFLGKLGFIHRPDAN